MGWPVKGSGWVWSSRVSTEGLAVPNQLSLDTWHGAFPGQTGKQGSAFPAAQPHLPGAQGLWGQCPSCSLLCGGQAGLCSSLLLSADAIINENYKYLKGFLEELAPPERSALIQDWELAGLVYLDYIRVNEMLDRIQQVLLPSLAFGSSHGVCRGTWCFSLVNTSSRTWGISKTGLCSLLSQQGWAVPCRCALWVCDSDK